MFTNSRETLERHITAIRLQELYKKRQEERENEEIEMRSIPPQDQVQRSQECQNYGNRIIYMHCLLGFQCM